ncbi:cation:proton antiporter [Alicyclobacillus kakegawensis]|uniref:cation:proton antiporter n=1 Tax=Alicyclobacillus kakegawensis TaxID=392012 RepID=UPI000830D7BF|nr:sodium:proton antiporter [Alicyclobacillus kakegawensis]
MLNLETWDGAWQALLLIFGGGVVVAKLTERPRIPDVAAFLVVGIVAGPYLLGWLSEPGQSQVNQFIINFGAVLILFDGGRAVSLRVLQEVWISVGLLATIGVLVSALVVAAAAHLALGLDWLTALLLGSVVASTDPATLIPVFSRVPIKPRLEQTVESESAFNDATASVLVFTLLDIVGSHQEVHWWQPVWGFLESAVVGLAAGLACGLAALWTISGKGWGGLHAYASIVMLVVALGSYELAEILHASGFMAAFAAGVVTGNGTAFRLPLSDLSTDHITHFGNGMTLLARMMIFVLLGSQVNFSAVSAHLWPGLLVVVVLMAMARPLTVLASTPVDRRAKWGIRDILFMFWVRETGVIPAALSGMLAARRVPGADVISSVTFLTILVTIVLQASTTGVVARRLGLDVPAIQEEV